MASLNKKEGHSSNSYPWAKAMSKQNKNAKTLLLRKPEFDMAQAQPMSNQIFASDLSLFGNMKQCVIIQYYY